MHYTGVAKGRTIELLEPLPYAEGQSIRVSVEPLSEASVAGSPALIRQVMQEPPCLTSSDVDAMEQAIQESRLPVTQRGEFDERN